MKDYSLGPGDLPLACLRCSDFIWELLPNVEITLPSWTPLVIVLLLVLPLLFRRVR